MRPTAEGRVVKSEIKVLDHGYVRLIDSMGTDETIIEAARMSTGRGFEGWEKDAKLLEFLYANRHMTPFEMCELHVEVKAPLFVFREWHRHRTWSYNEMSARYVQMPNEHYVPSEDRMRASAAGGSNKQGSVAGLGDAIVKGAIIGFAEEQQTIYEQYEHHLVRGLAKEVARINTPVARYSVMRAKTDLRNVLAFLALRLPANAQWEIRQYAEALAEIVRSIWPRTYALFDEHTLGAVTLSRSEAAALRAVMEDRAGETADLLPWSIGKKLGVTQ